MLDQYWKGPTSHISSEAPVPVIKIQDHEARPGGAANVAVNIAALGGTVYLLGITGQDEASQTLKKLLTEKKVQHDFIATPQQQTTTKLRIISQNQQLIRLDLEETEHQFTEKELLEKYKNYLTQCDIVILSDYKRGTLKNCQTFIQAAQKAKVPILIDPKQKDFKKYKGATILTPNLKELETIVGHCENDTELCEKASKLIKQCNIKTLLITRGAQGMSLIRENKKPIHLPTRAQQVYDVTGAGDTVIAMLATALAAGQNIREAMKLANSAAAVVVGKLGTSVVTVPELRRLLQSLARVGYGITTEEEIKTAITDARAYGETIVMTNGCFDILHAGHVNYLNKAKKLGHRLIVAINDDNSVKRLKGKDRPVNTLERRIAVLAALNAVDWVIPFSEDTPENIIKTIKPNVLVKGEDYPIEDIVGAEFVKKHGGKVKTIPFEEDCSTSEIIKTIRSTH